MSYRAQFLVCLLLIAGWCGLVSQITFLPGHEPGWIVYLQGSAVIVALVLATGYVWRRIGSM